MSEKEFTEIKKLLEEINNCRTKAHRNILINMIEEILLKHVAT